MKRNEIFHHICCSAGRWMYEDECHICEGLYFTEYYKDIMEIDIHDEEEDFIFKLISATSLMRNLEWIHVNKDSVQIKLTKENYKDINYTPIINKVQRICMFLEQIGFTIYNCEGKAWKEN